MPDRRLIRRQGKEHIHVIMNDGTYQHLTPPALEVMIEKNRVMKFRRSSGWVTLGIDPVRVQDRRHASCLFNRAERRVAS